MSLNVNVNISALKATHRYQTHFTNLNRSILRLSSGIKLNTAADSPVDMAVYNINNGRLGTLEKGKQNLIDAISMVQTAEAAMGCIDDLLLQMKVIAEQAATGTITDFQRMILSSEYHILSDEIDRIAHYTEFKSIKLLDGSISARNNMQRQGSYYTANRKHVMPEDIDKSQDGLKIHFGPANQRMSDYYFVKIGDLTMDGLLRDVGDRYAPSSEKISIDSQHEAQQALVTINTAMYTKESNRYVMGLMQNRMEASLNFMEQEMLHLQATTSALADTEFADEVIEMSRNQLLAEAASAMIAQANMIPKIAFKLLNF